MDIYVYTQNGELYKCSNFCIALNTEDKLFDVYTNINGSVFVLGKYSVEDKAKNAIKALRELIFVGGNLRKELIIYDMPTDDGGE